MKAFRKWWNKLLCSNNEQLEYIVEKGWRAALKEVLKVCEMYEEDKYHIISNWIKEELKDE